MTYTAKFWKNPSPGGWCTALRVRLGDAPAVERPALLLKVLPPERLGGHTGVGFELVLDPVVPQQGRELDEQIVDIPVRAGLKRLRGLQGPVPRQITAASPWSAQCVDGVCRRS